MTLLFFLVGLVIRVRGDVSVFIKCVLVNWIAHFSLIMYLPWRGSSSTFSEQNVPVGGCLICLTEENKFCIYIIWLFTLCLCQCFHITMETALESICVRVHRAVIHLQHRCRHKNI